MLKDKRGFWMGEEAGKFILGVIAVVLLLVFAFQMAGILRKDNQLQQARYTMDQISGAIESIQEGETKNVFIESPRGWYLQSFSKNLGYGNRPVACGVKDCLCLCKKTGKDECEKLGVCRAFQTIILIEHPEIKSNDLLLKLSPPEILHITQKNEKLFISSEHHINLFNFVHKKITFEGVEKRIIDLVNENEIRPGDASKFFIEEAEKFINEKYPSKTWNGYGAWVKVYRPGTNHLRTGADLSPNRRFRNFEGGNKCFAPRQLQKEPLFFSYPNMDLNEKRIMLCINRGII